MERYSIETWIYNAKSLSDKDFRKAVHIILHAISIDSLLRLNMIIKGGILLAIKYNSDRFTNDIDFSTSIKYEQFDEKKFISILEKKLSESVIHFTEYSIECKLQTFKTKPKPETNPTFPTICITIGYANKSDKRELERLKHKRSIKIVSIDYSFNEQTQKIDNIYLDDGFEIKAYSYTDLVAEKYRAILQQKVRRKKGRRQDLYDLHRLFSIHGALKGFDAQHTLNSLIIKSKSRDLEIDKYSMRDDKIIEKLKEEYSNLEDEIEGTLPEFTAALKIVTDTYEELPWDEKT